MQDNISGDISRWRLPDEMNLFSQIQHQHCPDIKPDCKIVFISLLLSNEFKTQQLSNLYPFSLVLIVRQQTYPLLTILQYQNQTMVWHDSGRNLSGLHKVSHHLYMLQSFHWFHPGCLVYTVHHYHLDFLALYQVAFLVTEGKIYSFQCKQIKFDHPNAIILQQLTILTEKL